MPQKADSAQAAVQIPPPLSAHAPSIAQGDRGRQRKDAPAVDTTFLAGGSPAAQAIGRSLAPIYARLAGALEGTRAAWLTRDHFVFFAVAAAGLLILMPRYLVLGEYAFERFALGMPVVKPNMAGWPYVPSIVLPLVGAGLLTFFVGASTRPKALVLFSMAGGFAFGYLDAPSLVVFAVFAAVSFAVIRLPIDRLWAAFLLCALAFGLLFVSVRWFPDRAIEALAAFMTPLIPMLWYSAYEHKVPRRPLAFRRFLAYLYGRFFAGPVMTYGDVFSQVAGPQLAEVRFSGIRALYIAAVASISAAGVELLLTRYQISELTGASLLLVSYLGYVGGYCKVVVSFNTVIGVLRLFGLPVRDNFQYWLLARTPNEHWQRWNLLFREWVITFVFFPIMRAKRWLFVATMTALLVSGILHLIPSALTRPLTPFHGIIEMGYWGINGLAIYLVIKLPTLFPRLVPALGMQGSMAWSVVGVVMTSSFYGILYGVRATCDNWTDVARFFERLVQSSL